MHVLGYCCFTDINIR